MMILEPPATHHTHTRKCMEFCVFPMILDSLAPSTAIHGLLCAPQPVSVKSLRKQLDFNTFWRGRKGGFWFWKHPPPSPPFANCANLHISIHFQSILQVFNDLELACRPCAAQPGVVQGCAGVVRGNSSIGNSFDNP